MLCAGSSLDLVRLQIAGHTVALNSVVVSMSFYMIVNKLANTSGDNLGSFRTSTNKGITFLTRVRLSNLSSTLLIDCKNYTF